MREAKIAVGEESENVDFTRQHGREHPELVFWKNKKDILLDIFPKKKIPYFVVILKLLLTYFLHFIKLKNSKYLFFSY